MVQFEPLSDLYGNVWDGILLEKHLGCRRETLTAVKPVVMVTEGITVITPVF